MLVPDLLRETAARVPDRAFLLIDDRAWTFAEIDGASDRIACDLQRAGVSRGDRVALCADNTAEFVASLFGISRAGGVLVPVSSLVKSERLASVLNTGGVRVLVADSRLGPVVGAALPRAVAVREVVWTGTPPTDAPSGRCLPEILARPHARPADPGLIDQDLFAVFHTSGSTGQPKGVMLTHRNLVSTASSIATYLGNTSDDVVSCVLPLSHTYGLCQVLVAALVGHAVVLERSFAFPYDVLRRMQRHRVTGFPGIPTVFAQLLQLAPSAGLDVTSLRYLTNAAAALPAAHAVRLQEQFPGAHVFLMYGQTECIRACYLDPARVLDKPASVGKAIPNSEAWVVDADGRRVGPGVVGELVVRGANVMRGYWGMAKETGESLRDGDIPGEKVLYTGDQFRTDEGGFLYFVGRSDDVFKCKGEKVSPSEVEHVLYELEEVAQAAVVGVEDRLDGQAVVAILVLRPGSTLSETQIRRHCRERLESYLVPKAIEIRNSLPLTDNGKLDRRALTRGGTRSVHGGA